MIPSVPVIAAEDNSSGSKFGTIDTTNITYVKQTYPATPAKVSILSSQSRDNSNACPAMMTAAGGATFTATTPDTSAATLEFSWVIAGPILGIVTFLAVFLSLLAKGKIGQKK